MSGRENILGCIPRRRRRPLLPILPLPYHHHLFLPLRLLLPPPLPPRRPPLLPDLLPARLHLPLPLPDRHLRPRPRPPPPAPRHRRSAPVPGLRLRPLPPRRTQPPCLRPRARARPHPRPRPTTPQVHLRCRGPRQEGQVDRRGQAHRRPEPQVGGRAQDAPPRRLRLQVEVESKASAAGAATKVKWAKEIKGKGCLEPWSNSYSVEETYGDDDHDDDKEKKPTNVKKKVKEDKQKTKKGNVEIVEIEDNTVGCVAIRKAFEMNHCKGKRKELSPQDAALLIQMNYRAHLAHRSQVLRCLRDLAVAKAKLKEIRSFFYNISYRRRIAHDTEERQRFAEKIIVLLLTVDALEVNS